MAVLNNIDDRTHSLTSASRILPDARPDAKHPPVSLNRRHASSVSIGSTPRHQRTTSSILSRAAAAALDRTHSAIASISEPVTRNRQSNLTLARLSLAAASSQQQQSRDEPESPDRPSALSYPSSQSLLSSHGDSKQQSSASSAQPSPTQQPSTGLSSAYAPSPSTMHQTSSRLLRMTDDDRPFTRVC